MAKITEAMRQEARLALARKDFFFYCQLTAGEFYQPHRAYLREICHDFQRFVEAGNEDVMVINVPPRHGKSRTAGKFVEWLLGRDHSKKIMTGSYNETLSTNFSKSVRNAIQERKADENRIILNDVFPNTAIKPGDGAMNLWSLEDGYQNYLATSPGGTATGFGADLIIIDDVIKNAEEAYNANVLDKHWEWFTNTMLSRLESGGKIILVMTRWHSEDLAGRALAELPKLGYTVKHINLKAMQDDGTMLCEDVLSKKEFERRYKTMSPEIASANYQQQPINLRGRLYSALKTYDGQLPEFKSINSYTDTADTGSDYLSSYIYGLTLTDEVYILDTIYTKEAMEVTEPLLAQKLYEHHVNVAYVESNNGGRGFARNVERLLREKYQTNSVVIQWFTQTKNKQARILSHSTWVMEHIYFPSNWRHRWPELYESVMSYQKEGKNRHDDAEDALTGVAERTLQQPQSQLTSDYQALIKAFK
ncbi:MAG: phage terminase large subunit [Aerococcus sp.]|nr:phage terminase large subunit [Aerococcus sp.]